MTVEELANKRYGGEFVFMLGHLEGVTRFVFECFDPILTYMIEMR